MIGKTLYIFSLHIFCFSAFFLHIIYLSKELICINICFDRMDDLIVSFPSKGKALVIRNAIMSRTYAKDAHDRKEDF